MALAYGASGAGVETLQVQLRGLGYNVEVDGAFGARTHDAVTHFQQQRRISVDGAVGDETLTALYAATAAGWRTPEANPWTTTPDKQYEETMAPGPARQGIKRPTSGAAMPGWLWIGIIAGIGYVLYANGAFGKLDGIEPDDGEE